MSSNQTQEDRVRDVAACILGKLRDMHWVMVSRKIQSDPHVGVEIFSDESLSSNIVDYDGMVDMIREQCETNLEMAKLAMRFVVAAVVCDGKNPFPVSEDSAGEDDDLESDDDDSRASSSSSLGRRSFSEIKETEGVPKCVATTRMNAPADSFDVEEEGEVRCAQWTLFSFCIFSCIRSSYMYLFCHVTQNSLPNPLYKH